MKEEVCASFKFLWITIPDTLGLIFLEISKYFWCLMKNLSEHTDRENHISKKLQSFHWKESEKSLFKEFCEAYGIMKEFLARKNPTEKWCSWKKELNHTRYNKDNAELKEHVTQLMDWAANTIVHIINMIYLRPLTEKAAYEMWKGRKPKLSYFHVFGNRCYILKHRD